MVRCGQVRGFRLASLLRSVSTRAPCLVSAETLGRVRVGREFIAACWFAERPGRAASSCWPAHSTWRSARLENEWKAHWADFAFS